MSELFESEEESVIITEEGIEDEVVADSVGESFPLAEAEALVEIEAEVEVEKIIQDSRHRPSSDARRRLENLLDEKRLRDELEDFLDY